MYTVFTEDKILQSSWINLKKEIILISKVDQQIFQIKPEKIFQSIFLITSNHSKAIPIDAS